jgi:nucleotide-binding universal stress UspA family protein
VQLRAVRSYFRPDWTTTSASAFYSTGGEFDEAQHELVEGQLAFLRSDFPDVAVSIAVSPHPIGDVLVNEAGTADLLVVGTRFADGHHYSRLGPTTGRVLHRSTVPVTVVGHTYATAAAPEAESSLTGI